MEKILAFSSSRVGNEKYLESAAPIIHSFLGDTKIKIAFIPFASVDGYQDYTDNVRQGLQNLPYDIITMEEENAVEIINHSNAILVGGGNTFKLLKTLYSTGALLAIQQKVKDGTPFIGWSAGANITGATICTTNDMPIVEPPSFNALGFFPFQINPHYYNQSLAGFNGETRDQRLTEFLIMNPTKSIVCLPEGTALKYENNHLQLLGICPAFVLNIDSATSQIVKKQVEPGSNLSELLARQ